MCSRAAWAGLSSTRLKPSYMPLYIRLGKTSACMNRWENGGPERSGALWGYAWVRAEIWPPAQGSFTTALHFSPMGSSDEFCICLVLFHNGVVSPTLPSHDPNLATVPGKQSGRSSPSLASARAPQLGPECMVGPMPECLTPPPPLAWQEHSFLAEFTQPNCLFCIPVAWHMPNPCVDSLVSDNYTQTFQIGLGELQPATRDYNPCISITPAPNTVPSFE